MEKIKKFLIENGFTSLLVIGVSLAAFIFGFKLIGATLLGVFIGRNWEIIKKLYNEHLKAKVDGVIDDVKDGL